MATIKFSLTGRSVLLVTLLSFAILTVATIASSHGVSASSPSFRGRARSAATEWMTSFAPGRAILASFFATRTVTNGSDIGAGSLRDTIAAASAGDTIVFQSGVTTVALTSDELLIDKLIIIDGGTSGVTVTRSSAAQFRIFRIASGGNLTLNGIAVTNGSSTTQAGGVWVQTNGAATITNSTIDGNSAPQGGGVQNDGILSMVGCIVSNNAATTAYGGGVLSFSSTTTQLTSCTITGNTALSDTGGAGNSGTGSWTVTNCTIIGNSSGSAPGGLETYSHPVKVVNSIIVGNTFGAGVNSDIDGAFTASKNNIIGVVAGGSGISNGISNNVVGATLNSAGIGTLGFYGGLTKTFPLLPGSIAINAASPADAPSIDQRSFSRFGTADIGAFESQGFNLAITGGNNQHTPVGNNFSAPLVVSVTPISSTVPLEPVDGGIVSFTPPGSGASASIAGTPATISGGSATTGIVTANSTGGSYNVTVSTKGATSLSFSLTNDPAPSFGNYSPVTVSLAGQTSITPSAAPANADYITASVSSDFQGIVTVDKVTGVVSITNAYPAGTYTVTLTGNGPGGTSTKTFPLTVGNGTICNTSPLFTAGNTLTANTPIEVKTGDFNNDGKQDLAVSNGSNSTISILLGDGTGGFSSATTFTVGSNPLGIAVGDLNGDGFQDLLVAVGGFGGVKVLMGDGTGNFSFKPNVTTGNTPKGIAIGDFNGDGKPDFAVSNFTTNTVSVRLGDGTGGFTGSTDIVVASGPSQVLTADFNGDGKLDIAVSSQIFNSSNNTFGANGTVTVLLGDGAGSFASPLTTTVDSDPETMTLADFNNDGKVDLVVACLFTSSRSLNLLAGVGDGTFTVTAKSGVSAGQVVVGDFNNDGKQDFAIKEFGQAKIGYFLGDGLGGLANMVEVDVSGALGSRMAIGDFNGDGKQDLVTNNFGSNSLFILLGGCNPNSAPVITGSPVSTAVCSGANAAFSASASGTPTPTVQWFVSTDGGATFSQISGATNTILTLTGVTASMSGNRYKATFTNSLGSATTNPATLTVNTAPTVTNPGNATVLAGNQATFSTTATGSPTPTLQWQVSTDGITYSNISGATAATLTISTTSADDGKRYRVVATNTCGSATSNAALLTIAVAPILTGNPTSTAVCAGANALFGSSAAGLPVPTPQWYVSTDGGATFTAIPGATNSVLDLGLAQTSMNGNKYRAVWTNIAGTVTTSAATLTVNTSPTVTAPTSITVAASSLASFTSTITGTPTPSLQWQVSVDNGASWTNIAGATSATLAFTAQVADNGKQFRIIATNTCDVATSAAATLTVTSGPQITQNPTDQTVNATQTATFTAAASGVPTPTVQWQFSNDGGATFQNVAGASSTTLTIPNVAAGQNGQKFRAVFTNSVGTATTTAATLTVNFAPTVITNPISQTVAAGSNATFTAAANGNPTPTVQWQQSTDGGATFSNIAGATSTTLSFTTLASQNGNQFRAVFTNSVGSATTTAATLTVTSGPAIIQNPIDQTVNATQTATFTAAASGVPTPTVQWQFSNDGGATFQNVAGATSTTLTIPNVAAGQNGQKFRAVFTNSVGTATTTAATLTVNFAPTVITNPISQTVAAGSNATFTAAANGNPTPTVQWQQSTDGGATFSNIAGATSTTLSFTTLVTQNGNQFRAVFTNSVGSATTTAATLSVTTGPNITGQPLSTAVCAGTSVGFGSAATGNPTPTVQWFVSTDNGVTFNPVPGATSATLSLGPAQASMSGNQYKAVYTNTSGTATTNTATLNVNTAPVVTTNPTNQLGTVGALSTFTAGASGTPTPAVKWQVSTDNGVTWNDIAGATNTTLSFIVQQGDFGHQFRAVFSNLCGGSVSTTAATLIDCSSVQVTADPTSQNVLKTTTATFTASASGNPTPTVQWEVSTDGGNTFTNVPGATSTTLTLTSVTLSMNGNRYRAVFSNTCSTVRTQSAVLQVSNFDSSFTDPLVCTGPGDLMTGIAALQNNGPQTNASYTIAALGPNLIGIPGSGIAIDPATNQPIGTITVTAGSVNWTGTLNTGQSVNITYKATLAPGVQQNVQFCINASGTVGNMTNTIQVCATPGCPAGRVPVLVNDQKAGSVLIFPYYTSGNGADTRITLTNTSNLLATPQNPNYTFVHLMFIDGATCQQADQYVCLTPNASLTIKTSEYDPGATGWVLAVAVDANGLPIKNNVLIGNAFVSDGVYQDNYGAEALAANNAPLAAVVGGQARLFFDGQSYDAVPKAFSVELQSPVDVVGQKIVTVGLNGIVGSAMTGALQVGTGLVINGKESPASSFVNLLTGGCQATGLISTSSPRVSLGMSKLIPSGQSGTINFNTGPAVGILMTPKASKFGGIRTLHKTVMTTTSITIPVFVPSC